MGSSVAFSVSRSGFRVFQVEGLEFRVSRLRSRVECLGFQDLAFRVQRLGFRVSGHRAWPR